jgi:hypothetical protein
VRENLVHLTKEKERQEKLYEDKMGAQKKEM